MNIVLFLSHIFTAVYGGLDIHGKQRSPVQSFLTATANAGASEITIGHDVDWQVCLSLSQRKIIPKNTDSAYIIFCSNMWPTFEVFAVIDWRGSKH